MICEAMNSNWQMSVKAVLEAAATLPRDSLVCLCVRLGLAVKPSASYSAQPPYFRLGLDSVSKFPPRSTSVELETHELVTFRRLLVHFVHLASKFYRIIYCIIVGIGCVKSQHTYDKSLLKGRGDCDMIRFKFCGPNDISGVAKARSVKICKHVDYIDPFTGHIELSRPTQIHCTPDTPS